MFKKMTFKKLTAAIALSLVSVPAMAACVTKPEFVEKGMRIIDKDGSWVSYTADGAYITETEYDAEGVPQYWFKSLHGLFIVEEGDFKDGKADPTSKLFTSYNVALDQLPQVNKGMYEVLDLKIVDAKGAPNSTTTHTYKYTIDLPTKLEDCTYDTARIFATFIGQDDRSWGEFMYFKEFGLIYYIGYGDLGKGPEQRFTPIKIELGE